MSTTETRVEITGNIVVHHPVISYVVVDRDGGFIQDFGLDRVAAQAFADEWISDCKTAGIDWDYRVAVIVEAAA